MTDVNTCLNCTLPKCNGDYPHCQPKVRKRSKLKELDKGDGTTLVCLLARLGYTVPEIMTITDAQDPSIRAMLRQGVKKGIISEEVIDDIRIYNKRK